MTARAARCELAAGDLQERPAGGEVAHFQIRRPHPFAGEQELHRDRLARVRTIEVLVDEVEKTSAIGRSAADAPEIDGVVRVKRAKGAKPGDFIRVKVTGADQHDLSATA